MLKTPKTVAIVANGQIEDTSIISKKLKEYDFVIAADGGAVHCLKMGIIPHLLMGDFDSINSHALEMFSNVPKMTFLRDKDETDLELAITHAFLLNPEKVTLFAATGNRTDHLYVHLNLLRRFPAKLYMETENETIFSINHSVANPKFTMRTTTGTTLSLLPIGGQVTDVTTEGLKWELKNKTLDGNFFSISNICLTDSVSISLQDGDLLCFLETIENPS